MGLARRGADDGSPGRLRLLRVLGIPHLGGRRFRDVNRTTADERTARRESGEFR